MQDVYQIKPELQYGAPVCDQILTCKYYTIGYSWYFRQAKWTLEIIDPEIDFLKTEVEREDRFRADTRIPELFRAGLHTYEKSGFDRGHLVASANQDQRDIQNSETFLLSNISPQNSRLNQGKWKQLEEAVRTLDQMLDAKKRRKYLETYVLTAPVFYFQRKIETIGKQKNSFGIDVPIPHAYVKSVLAVPRNGRLQLWTFLMENEKLEGDLEEYLVSTYYAEQLIGGQFWGRVHPKDLHSQKENPRKMWKY